MSDAVARVAEAIDALRAHWGGRRVLLTLPRYTAAARGVMDELRTCGATVAGVMSAGAPTPDAPPVPHAWHFAVRGAEPTAHAFDRRLAAPPAELARWLETVDPDRSCTVLGSTFTHVGEVCGRPVHGWRRPEWAVWEDKTRIEELWRRGGVPSPAHTVLPVNAPDLPGRVAEVDGGHGVVLALDATRGTRGDATGLRWVRHPHELDEALAWARGLSDRLRAARYVAGVPCSVLGMVLRDGVAVFDPIEIVTLREPATGRLVFCGSSTWWRPPEERAEEIRRHARTAGGLLAGHGFRGMFSVDGVLGETGFLATELNPRHASGLGLRAGWPDFPLYLFQRAVQEGLPGLYDLDPEVLQEAFRTVVRDHPSLSVRVPGRGGAPHAGRPTEVGGTTGPRVLAVAGVTSPQPVEQLARFRPDDSGAVLLDLAPRLPDGLVAPAAAALARALDAGELTGCHEPPPRSTLATHFGGDR